MPQTDCQRVGRSFTKKSDRLDFTLKYITWKMLTDY